jgi:hypothetical protein
MPPGSFERGGDEVNRYRDLWWFGAVTLLSGWLAILPPGLAGAADDSRVKAATDQVERGAKQVGHGEVGRGVEETAKGIGNTVVEGAKLSGRSQGVRKAAEEPAKSAWQNFSRGVRLRPGVELFVPVRESGARRAMPDGTAHRIGGTHEADDRGGRGRTLMGLS